MSYSWFSCNPINVSADLVSGGMCLYSNPFFFLTGTMLMLPIGLYRGFATHDNCYICHPKQPEGLATKTINVMQGLVGFDQSLLCSGLSKIGLISTISFAALAWFSPYLSPASNIASVLAGARTSMFLGRLFIVVILVLKS
jgi:hypothetical protein